MRPLCRHYSCGMRLLLRNGAIYANGPQPLTSMLIIDDRIAWVGRDHDHHNADRVLDLDGRLVTPAFVDAHVHATATGLNAVDCAAPHPDQMLGRFQGSDGVVIGHGWEDTDWPTAWFAIDDLDARVGNTAVYASRIDVHSAFVSSALLAQVPQHLDGWSATGVLTRAAHAAAREIAFALLSDDQRRSAQQRTMQQAVRQGVAGLQEMAGPQISSYRDAELLLEARDPIQPHLTIWWGELQGSAVARELGAFGVGGDLVIDGSVGSRTAAFCDQYSDAETMGSLYQDPSALEMHIAEAVELGMPTAFHAIGDAATHQVLQSFVAVSQRVGPDRIRAGRHRIEHCELLDDADLRTMADLGIIASVQPRFDLEWGGVDHLYARRLGSSRSVRMNRFRTMATAGIQLAFGSDSPVTPLDPWTTVHAAQFHTVQGERLTQRAAISAHTRGGWRSIGIDDAGILAEGWEATLAVWETDDAPTFANDKRIARWSTDPRAGIPQLPDMRQARCVMTMRRGETLFDALG